MAQGRSARLGTNSRNFCLQEQAHFAWDQGDRSGLNASPTGSGHLIAERPVIAHGPQTTTASEHAPETSANGADDNVPPSKGLSALRRSPCRERKRIGGISAPRTFSQPARRRLIYHPSCRRWPWLVSLWKRSTVTRRGAGRCVRHPTGSRSLQIMSAAPLDAGVVKRLPALSPKTTSISLP